MDNPARYGFRPYQTVGGSGTPTIIDRFVESAQSFDVSSGAQNINLRAGDLVREEASGGMILCDGAETTALAAWGVVARIDPYWDGTRMRPSWYLPSDTTYGSVLDRQSWIGVIPIRSCLWEVDVDDIVTATTEAAYQALIGSNVNHINTGASGELYAKPKIDISTTNTTNTLLWRIVGVSKTKDNRDFSGANVKIIVEANLFQSPPSNTTGL